MGEVYRARDPKLGRDLAIKVLPERLASDVERLRRFEQEARLASSLNHPNIVTIYEIGESRGVHYIAMELVDGRTLRAMLRSGPLAASQAGEIAVQLAGGLAKAHGAGIVHRDLKPDNIMFTADGFVKILDFGLSKLVASFGEAEAAAETTELAASARTNAGVIMGTASYMSPEQAAGRDVNFASDQFAFGLVLYELLTGRVAFQRATIVQTMSAIITEEPAPAAELAPGLSHRWQEIIERCLAKEPSKRYASTVDLARDARAALGRADDLDRMRSVSKPAALASRRLVWVVAVVAIASVAIVGAIVLRRVRAGEPPLPAKKNIAVLPFRAAPDTPESRASADGLSVELSAMLGRLGVSTALQIAPAEVVRAAHVADAALARREVSANFVLSGTFEQSAGHLRIDAALIDTATARPIRTRVISGSDADPFTFEDRLLDAAVQMLDLPLGPGDRSRLVARDTLVAAAAMAYLQGRGALQSYEKPENVDRAIAAFDRALALDPKYARAYAGRGEAFWRRFEATKATQWTDAALASCARALVLDARLSAAGTCLGRVHDGTGRYEEAVVEYQRALESDPVNSEAYAGLGHAQEKLGRFDDAEATYRAAVRLRPQFWVNYNRLGSFYFSRARYAEAAEMFAQVIALAPDSFRGYSNLGGAYIQLGRYDDAIEAFNKSAAIRPTPTAYSNLGTALFNRGRFAEAARTFEQGVKLAESDARNAQHLRELYGGLADAYYWAPNERPRAAEAYRKAIALAAAELRVNPRDEFVLVDVGAYHAMLGERAEAHELLDRALKLAPSNADIQFRAAVAFHQIGELDPALNALERARAAGYSATVIRDTPNFSDLWQYPRFQKILRGQ